MDLEETTTEEGFLNLIIGALRENDLWRHIVSGVSKGMTSVLDKIEKVTIGPVELNIGKEGGHEDLYKELKELIRHDENTFIVVDELTLFLGMLNKAQTDWKRSPIY